jgi:hypothetical protein
MDDRGPEHHLQVLCERNADLERRREKLNALLQGLSDNIQRVQAMFQAMLTSQENQCIDMVSFDDEIKSLTRTLFPAASKQAPRPREQDQHQRMLLEQMMALQRLDPAQRLPESDPLIARVRLEAAAATRFMQKYQSFL